MTFESAIQTLRTGGEWTDLAEAIGVVASDPQSSLLDLLLGIKHGGVVAEQAILGLYDKAGIALPDDRSTLISSTAEWVQIIAESYGDLDEGVSLHRNAAGARKEWIPRHIIENLSREERLVLILYYYEKLTPREIAAAMDLSEFRAAEIHRSALHGVRKMLASDAVPLSNLLRDVVA